MLRRLLATLFAVGVSIPLTLGLLWVVEGDTASAQETKNCPPGFHWERYPSPIGCVQTELPAHGKIGFDGYAICEDGYVGDSERRPTTDGQPAPGSPYTSFPYLLGCYSPEEYAQLQAAGKLPSQTSGGASESGGAAGGGGVLGAGGAPGNGVQEAIRDASEALYDGGGGPSNGELAALGVGFGLGFGLWSFGTFVLGSSPIGAGVYGGRETPTLGREAGLEASVGEAMDQLKRLRQQRMEAARRLRAAADLLSFYRWHYWTGLGPHAARLLSLTIFTALGGYYLVPAEGLAGAYFAVEGTKAMTALKVSSGLAAGGLTAQSMWTPPKDVQEAAKWIEKIKPRVEAATQKLQELNRKVLDAERRVRSLESEAQGW